jgi:hypothetical protein
MEICSKVNILSALFVTNENKKAIFDYQYENLLLKGQLRAYVDGLYAHVSEPSLQMIDDLTPFVEDVINYIPKANEIENKLNQGGQYAWSENVYSLYMDNIRSQILSSIKQVSSRSVKTIQSKVQDDIVRLLFDAGDDIDDLMILCDADITSKNEEKKAKYHNNFQLVRKKLKELEEKDHLRNWQPPVNGEVIMTTFGITEGRNVGIIKTAIREAVLDGIIGNNFAEAYEFMKAEGEKLGLTVVQEVTEPIEVKSNGPVPNKIEK